MMCRWRHSRQTGRRVGSSSVALRSSRRQAVDCQMKCRRATWRYPGPRWLASTMCYVMTTRRSRRRIMWNLVRDDLPAPDRLCPAELATAQAKTLVYCSEGSPENFDPMLNTTGTTFDANLPIYNSLVEFKIGHHRGRAGARRELGHLGGRHDLHLPSAPRRQVASNTTLQADARLQRRRRAVLVRAPVEGHQPVSTRYRAAATTISTT